MKRARVLASLVAMAAIASGCGSSYKGLSKAEFVKQANAICAKTTKANDALGKQLPKNATHGQITKLFLEEAIPLYHDQFDQIEALKPPKADRATVKKILAEARSATDGVERDMKTNPAKVFSSTVDPYKKANADANAYGLTVCGAT